MHLSKSGFKVARTGPTKLYYRKLRYPKTTDGAPYLEFLADGGYMVETIAKLLFPDGREIGFGQGEDAVGQTTAENPTLFEARVQYGLLLARIARGGIMSKWRPYRDGVLDDNLVKTNEHSWCRRAFNPCRPRENHSSPTAGSIRANQPREVEKHSLYELGYHTAARANVGLGYRHGPEAPEPIDVDYFFK